MSRKNRSPSEELREQDAAYDTRSKSVEQIHPRGRPIDEDLYCLTCGYNLRGLYGDPVRCPECGILNELGAITIPAEFIRQAVRSMETAPTAAVGLAVCGALDLVFVFLAPWPGRLIPLAILLVLGCGWSAAMRRARAVFRREPGWMRILWSFHLIMVAWLGAAIFFIVSMVYIDDLYPSWLSGLLYAASFGVLILGEVFGGITYRKLRAEIAVTQRNEAVRIGREHLRRALQSGAYQR